MFVSKTEKIKKIAIKNKKVITQLSSLFLNKTNIYIDYANVKPWANRLGWHIDLKRLKQFLDSFNNINNIKFYYGVLKGDQGSEKRIEEAKRLQYEVRTKFVKIMNISIDATSIELQSIALLKSFIRMPLLEEYEIKTIEYLNNKFKEMNKRGIMSIKDRKCNFDVEISNDILIDKENEKINTFVLWSGDSDFYDPLNELLEKGKKVVLFATARVVARELNDLKKKGLFIFDIKKIKEFICWNKELCL